MYQEDVTHFLPVLAHKKLVRTSLIVLPVTQYGDYVVSDVINVAHGERNQWMTLAWYHHRIAGNQPYWRQLWRHTVNNTIAINPKTPVSQL